MKDATTITRSLQRAACFIAPLLMATSTFFWNNGAYGLTGGTLLIGSLVFWIYALQSLFGLLEKDTPHYSVWGYFLAVVGCISGINFAFWGVISEAFDLTQQALLDQASIHAMVFNLLLFWTGPLFPLSLLIVGIVLLLKKKMPIIIAILLCLAGVAFPLSRIPRIEWVAHLSDLILMIPLFYRGIYFQTEPSNKS